MCINLCVWTKGKVTNSISLNSLLGGVWGCHRRARWYAQSGWCMETQLHHLHCVKVLVLPHPVCYLWYPCFSALGLPVCMHLLLPHLGCGPLHQELPDWVAVRQPHLFSLHSDLLRSLLRSLGQDFQQCARCTAKRSLSTQTVAFIVWSAESFYTPLDQSWNFALLPVMPPTPFTTCCSPPSHPELTALLCILQPEALWQLQQAAWLHDSQLRALYWVKRGPLALSWGSCQPSFIINRAYQTLLMPCVDAWYCLI